MEEKMKKIAEELGIEWKFSIRKGPTIGLIEEIADVKIMLEQTSLCDIHPKDIAELKTYKMIDRLRESKMREEIKDKELKNNG